MATPSQEGIQAHPGRISRWTHTRSGTQGSHQDPSSRAGGQAVWGEASTWLATGQSRTRELEAPGRGTQQLAASLLKGSLFAGMSPERSFTGQNRS